MVAGYAMSILNFLPFRRRPRPPDIELARPETPIARPDDLPVVANLTRLHLLMLLLGRP